MNNLALCGLLVAFLSACSGVDEASPVNPGATLPGGAGSAGGAGMAGVSGGSPGSAGGAQETPAAPWSRSFGGVHDDVAVDMAVDERGHAFVLVRVVGDVPTAQGVVGLSGATTLLEVNDKGEVERALPLTTSLDRYALRVGLGKGGEIFLLGDGSAASLDLGPGCQLAPSAKAGTVLIKLNSDGSCGWIRGYPLVVSSPSLGVSSSGDLAIAGSCNQGGDLGDGVSLFVGSNWGPVAVPCVAVFDPQGDPLWARALGEAQTTSGHARAIFLADGGVAVAGVAKGELRLDEGVALASGGFVGRYQQGKATWARSIEGAISVAMAADLEGGVFLHTRAGEEGSFFSRVGGDGQERWRKAASEGDIQLELSSDRWGNLLAAGSLLAGAGASLGGASGVKAAGDTWVEAALSPQGEQLWVSSTSSSKPVEVRRVAAGAGGDFWALGGFSEAISLEGSEHPGHPKSGEVSRDVLLTRRPRGAAGEP